MNDSLGKVNSWFEKNKINFNPSRTWYMIFNHCTDETKLVRINDQFLERVREKEKEKSFKLLGIHVQGERKNRNSYIYVNNF